MPAVTGYRFYVGTTEITGTDVDNLFNVGTTSSDQVYLGTTQIIQQIANVDGTAAYGGFVNIGGTSGGAVSFTYGSYGAYSPTTGTGPSNQEFVTVTQSRSRPTFRRVSAVTQLQRRTCQLVTSPTGTGVAGRCSNPDNAIGGTDSRTITVTAATGPTSVTPTLANGGIQQRQQSVPNTNYVAPTFSGSYNFTLGTNVASASPTTYILTQGTHDVEFTLTANSNANFSGSSTTTATRTVTIPFGGGTVNVDLSSVSAVLNDAISVSPATRTVNFTEQTVAVTITSAGPSPIVVTDNANWLVYNEEDGTIEVDASNVIGSRVGTVTFTKGDASDTVVITQTPQADALNITLASAGITSGVGQTGNTTITQSGPSTVVISITYSSGSGWLSASLSGNTLTWTSLASNTSTTNGRVATVTLTKGSVSDSIAITQAAMASAGCDCADEATVTRSYNLCGGGTQFISSGVFDEAQCFVTGQIGLQYLGEDCMDDGDCI